MKVAVIILNYNSSADCRKCIVFLKQQVNVDQEIVVVDNCSRYEDRIAVEDLCKEQECTFVANHENKGYSAGNNVGLRYAAEKGYEYALIANPDMEFPEEDYLEKMIFTMEGDSSIAVCGSDIRTPEGLRQNPLLPDNGWRESFKWIKDSIWGNKKNGIYNFIEREASSHYCSKVSGCCLMVNMGFIREIEYFDESPFLYCEEAILSKQIEQSNKWHMYYESGVQAIHRHIKSEKGNPVDRYIQWLKSRLYYINTYSSDNWLGRLLEKLSVRLQVCSYVLKQHLFFKRYKVIQ